MRYSDGAAGDSGAAADKASGFGFTVLSAPGIPYQKEVNP